MNESIDVTAVVQEIRDHLIHLGMSPRGADRTDYQFDGDRSLFFRTGTSYGEVTIAPYVNEHKHPPIRVLNSGQVDEAKAIIDDIIEHWKVTKEILQK